MTDGDASGEEQQSGDHHESLETRHRAITPWIDHDGGRVDVEVDCWSASLGLDDRRVAAVSRGEFAGLPTESEGAEAFGPGVHGRVDRRFAVKLGPGHLAQTPAVDDMGSREPLDHRQRVALRRQHVARQDPAAPPTRPAAGQGHDELPRHDRLCPVRVPHEGANATDRTSAAQLQLAPGSTDSSIPDRGSDHLSPGAARR